eukprot:CAMPEP_0201867814 /NCGR_PEP_ID=MMETSP0902-20130614/1933_1 /ASSEMBLY_ACC=CAM_ASM_000551 /TAXON_ID=420261 /ORGANISM="Thalassiosira antarctica, Strain CCMP982" /LENGTH=44 /DNA_ID= /DNA_START= /DNA_END= /DNA_ORIENTATION=
MTNDFSGAKTAPAVAVVVCTNMVTLLSLVKWKGKLGFIVLKLHS